MTYWIPNQVGNEEPRLLTYKNLITEVVLRTLSTLFLIILIPCTILAEDNPKPFMGVNHQLLSELPEVPGAPAAQGGVQITTVQKETPAFKAGLLAGDIVIGLDGVYFDVVPDSISAEFTRLLYKHGPGETMNMHILRLEVINELVLNGEPADWKSYIKSPEAYLDSLPPGSEISFNTSKNWKIIDVPIVLGKREEFKLPPLPEIAETKLGKLLKKKRVKGQSKIKCIVDEVVDRYKLNEDYDDLRARLRGIEAGDDGTRLTAMAEIHRNPFFIERYGRYLTDMIIKDKYELVYNLFCNPDISVCLTGNTTASFKKSRFKIKSDIASFDENELKNWFEKTLGGLIEDLNSIYAVLTEDEKAFLEEYMFELTDVHAQGIYVWSDEDPERYQRNLKTIELGSKIDIDALTIASHKIARFVRSTEAQIFKWSENHPEVKVIEAKWGKIGFGTTGYDRWASPEFKFIYGPDGNDFYANGTGTANSFAQPVSWIIDQSGNDAYQSTEEGAQGSGLPGIGFLIDYGGDDTYISGRWSQGCGYLGVGVLLDVRGDDNYHGTEFVQGSALFGLGVLADLEGNDNYSATIYAQGIGFTHGLGMLIDYAGNDIGYSTGKHPTNYGDPGIFDAWSQGCGMGFRGVASGGIGVLVDAAGEDKWEAGNFSQGGGYYYGFGLFRSAGTENDTYIGSRYAQGFCAHQAAGFFLEDGGNDYYTTRQSVTSGLAWDESVTIFIDENGDDYYNGGGGFSLGASAHNGFCLFLDRDGQDIYDYKPGPARAGGNNYHGGSSFSLFLDQGDAEDQYTNEKVGNDIELAWPEYGVFRDGEGVVKSPLEKPVKEKKDK